MNYQKNYKQFQMINHVVLLYKKAIKELAYDYDLSFMGFEILTLIKAGEGDIATELVGLMGTDKATLSVSLANLEAKGYIIRKQDDGDKRIKHIHLRTNGWIVCNRIEEKYIEMMVEKIEVRNRKKLYKILRKILPLEK